MLPSFQSLHFQRKSDLKISAPDVFKMLVTIHGTACCQTVRPQSNIAFTFSLRSTALSSIYCSIFRCLSYVGTYIFLHIAVTGRLVSLLLKIMTKHGSPLKTWGNFMALFHTKWQQQKEHCSASVKMELKDSVAPLVMLMRMTPSAHSRRYASACQNTLQQTLCN